MAGLQKRTAKSKKAGKRKRGRQDPRLAQAQAARRANQPQEAARLYMQILEQHPSNADALTAFGDLKYRLGDLSGARNLFERALLAGPHNPRFLSNLAVVLKDQGLGEQAQALLERALGLDAKFSAGHNNLGNVFKAQGKLDEAERCFSRALAIDPSYRTALGNLADVQLARSRPQLAATHLKRLLELEPSSYEAHLKLGRAFVLQERHRDAIAAYQQALRLKPNSGTACAELGVCYRAVGDWQKAATALRQAEQLGIDSLETLTELGSALTQLGKITEAAAYYQRIIDKQADNIDALVRLALLSVELGHMDQAEQLVQRALTLNPGPAMRSALAFVLHESGEFSQAEALLESVLARPDSDWGSGVASRAGALGLLSRCQLNQGMTDQALETSHLAATEYPDDIASHVHHGVALVECSEFDRAQSAFERALALDPEHPTAHLNLAMCQLMRGDFAHGWDEYEWRLREKRLRVLASRFAQLPRYRGEALPEKTLLVYCEQGFGDAIQFLRFTGALKQRCEGRLVVACRRPLMRLASTAPGVDQVVDRDAPLPHADACLPLMSAPRLLGIGRTGLAADQVYLRVPSNARQPTPLASAAERPRVGIVWAGSPKFKGDIKRSMKLELWQPALRVDGIDFFSLQVGGSGSVDLPECMTDLAPFLGDFADTAAALRGLNLVISVDTSVAHLAGALGTPVWTLIPKVPDWRWGVSGSSTSWYSSMTLFRQHEPGDWGEVLDRVSQALVDWRDAR